MKDYDKETDKTTLKDLPPVEISSSDLSDAALKGVIDNFLEREGTDYGLVEASYETKFRQLQNQILSQKIKIVYDPNSESVTLLTLQQWQKVLAGFGSA